MYDNKKSLHLQRLFVYSVHILIREHRARQPKAKSGYIAAEIFCSNVGCEHGSSTEHDTFSKKVIDEKKQGGYNTNQQQILQEAAYEH